MAAVDPSVYDRSYFLGECEGHESFGRGGGELSARLSTMLLQAEVGPEDRVLDVGCGRGEIVRACGERGARAYGIDYSAAAVDIAAPYLRAGGTDDRTAVLPADATSLPFAGDSFDVVFMLDIVEHLYPEQLARALAEARRVLRPAGLLYVHTAPNLWYYRVGYPLYRALRGLQGRRLPKDPKDRFASHHIVHVNEQSALSLRRALRRAGFACTVWVEQTQDRLDSGESGTVRALAHMVTHAEGLKWFFCGDVFAIARKPAGRDV